MEENIKTEKNQEVQEDKKGFGTRKRDKSFFV